MRQTRKRGGKEQRERIRGGGQGGACERVWWGGVETFSQCQDKTTLLYMPQQSFDTHVNFNGRRCARQFGGRDGKMKEVIDRARQLAWDVFTAVKNFGEQGLCTGRTDAAFGSSVSCGSSNTQTSAGKKTNSQIVKNRGVRMFDPRTHCLAQRISSIHGINLENDTGERQPASTLLPSASRTRCRKGVM